MTRSFSQTWADYVLKPWGIPPTFWNPTDRPARLVEIISPEGFEQMLCRGRRTVQEYEAGPRKIKALGDKYHVSLGWDEWVPELTKK
ncbi:MAG TPA: hypothetical protein VNA15_04285 [Candidatus Angelobacter sp.]|nr:hypothetical protein [Candidatus Angelobacter sp.]